MTAPVTFFRSIPIEVPLKMILTRLGYRSRKTVLSAGQRDKLEQTIGDSFALCEAQGCWRRVTIIEKNEDEVVLAGNRVLKSRSLATLLSHSDAVVLMATTVGPDIVEAAADAVARGDGATAVILDAVGGQSADAAMNWINAFVRSRLSRRAERLTSQRFSPGYGDFSLDNQALFFDLLELERLGLSLTSRAMLVPEKSVTAVAGIEAALSTETTS
jgi:hypothetical protein